MIYRTALLTHPVVFTSTLQLELEITDSFPLWMSMATRLANSGMQCPPREPNRNLESGDHSTFDVPSTRIFARLLASSKIVRFWPSPSSAASHLPSGDQAPSYILLTDRANRSIRHINQFQPTTSIGNKPPAIGR